MVLVEKEKDSRYLSVDSTKDGDIAEIMSEGTMGLVVKEMKLNLDVKVGNDELIYTPWPNAKNLLIDAFGTETKNWIGKKFIILHVNKKLIIRPISDTKV